MLYVVLESDINPIINFFFRSKVKSNRIFFFRLIHKIIHYWIYFIFIQNIKELYAYTLQGGD